MIFALTGHRPDKLNYEYDYIGPCSRYIYSTLKQVINTHKPTSGISGMALGADTLWALSLIKMGIPLTVAIPFIGQESRWPSGAQQMYNWILERAATKVVVCEGGYAPWKMQKRNAWMVDHCDQLVAVWDQSKGGTGNCVQYANKVGKPLISVDPNGWKM